ARAGAVRSATQLDGLPDDLLGLFARNHCAGGGPAARAGVEPCRVQSAGRTAASRAARLSPHPAGARSDLLRAGNLALHASRPAGSAVSPAPIFFAAWRLSVSPTAARSMK